MVKNNPVEGLYPVNQPSISWNKSAYASLQKAYEFIRETSPANAEMVKTSILSIIRSIPLHPEKYPLDRFKRNNNGSYRAFEQFSYRVAYRHTEKTIKILRVRHVKKEPKLY